MKKFIIFWVICLCTFIALEPNVAIIKEKTSSVPSVFIAKLIGSFFAPLWADILWIESAKEGEIRDGAYKVDLDNFNARFKVISTLNGDFFIPVRYGSTFLLNVAKKDGISVISNAQRWAKDNKKLNELELVARIAYEKPPNFERIRFLAQNVDGGFILPSEALIYAANDDIKKEIAKKDLQDLAKNAKNEAQKKATLDALAKLN